ncbi:hypothetical protein BGZ94_008724 [Podila epigama]|nr:hypothetical protein BGZ94_008724 [Podila epigama]
MPLPPGSFVFCERGRMVDICHDVDGIRIESTDTTLEGAIERNREVATAVSFTGDPIHKIQVVVITIEHPDVHCARLEKVFDKLRIAGARPKETPFGQLFVTNLSLFASSLNIVLVPQDGDFDLYQRRFYLNLNLRRMGCSGRSALTSKSPSDAQREKFNQLYKISDSGDFEDTVIRLVELVQSCLFIFGLFNLADVDGLLCNATEMGLDQFYLTFLSSKFQVPKDPFADPLGFINAVKAFQIKKPDLKACFLDSKTVDAINVAYQSSFNPQGLKVHKVLKSKIEDFSGMTAVNPEGETTDLEVFAKHIHTESLKQVWRGKPKHKTDMADALVSGDWLTGGKELGKSLVRGLAKTTRDTKNASQSLKSMAGGKNRQSLLLPKGKIVPFLNLKEGGLTDDTLVTSAHPDPYSPKSDVERNDGYETDEGTQTTHPLPAGYQASEDEMGLFTGPNGAGPINASSDTSMVPTPPVLPQFEILTSLFSAQPEEPGPPEIVAFNLERQPIHTSSTYSPMDSAPYGPRKRSQSMTGLAGHERLLGCRIEAAESTGAIPGIQIGSRYRIDKHPAFRKRSSSFCSFNKQGANLKPLKSVVVECDTQNYYSYQLLKDKEENLKALYSRMQEIECEFANQLESLKSILSSRSKQYEEVEREANDILTERRDLLAEVREREHATQRSVYHLEGMVGKLVEMRDFTGAFFNKISYLDTKLPASQRRLALWMDKLQALQSQWFRTIGRYMTAYAPLTIRNRFVEWEKDVQQAALKARELRGEAGEIQAGISSVGSSSSSMIPSSVSTGPTPCATTISESSARASSATSNTAEFVENDCGSTALRHRNVQASAEKGLE